MKWRRAEEKKRYNERTSEHKRFNDFSLSIHTKRTHVRFYTVGAWKIGTSEIIDIIITHVFLKDGTSITLCRLTHPGYTAISTVTTNFFFFPSSLFLSHYLLLSPSPSRWHPVNCRNMLKSGMNERKFSVVSLYFRRICIIKDNFDLNKDDKHIYLVSILGWYVYIDTHILCAYAYVQSTKLANGKYVCRLMKVGCRHLIASINFGCCRSFQISLIACTR